MADDSAPKAKARREGSRSEVQRDAERLALSALSSRLGKDLTPDVMTFGGATVAVDGIWRDGHEVVLAEVFARIGTLKPGQVRKVEGDVLKLAWLRRELERGGHQQVRALLVFVDQAAMKFLEGKGWCAAAARAFGVEWRLVQLPEEMLRAIQAQQQLQNFYRPDEPAS